MGSLHAGCALPFGEGGETLGGEDGVITGSDGSLDSLPLLASPLFTSPQVGLSSWMQVF